jgi:hypothetical protein
MQFRVNVNDHTYEVTPGPGDLVRFERQYDLPVTVLDDEKTVRTEYVYFIVWCAMKRKGQFTGDFEEFLDGLGDMEEESAPFAPPAPHV